MERDHLLYNGTSSVVLGSVDMSVDQDADYLVGRLLERINRREFFEDEFQISKVPDEIFNTLTAGQTSIAEIARQVGYSREGFIRKFAREIGMTPHAYRLAYRANHARDLLRSSMPPAAAAYESGFADQSHLGRVFRKSFGTTPAAFRRVWSG